ncbi:anti-sigma factor [Candidatus Mycobacterium wuenschmannii]|uniref:Anti-sigma-K factor RskA n=1 Tax=Candidatus Mycobacterium wuenschmannii TaxID=3027808 RepID=A0ABY8VUG5_9MYCO|nr:anti-sigma factor [Candidatus Mycobacterium wuenschmannii]WIM87270.1 anti-sigma factor [Candidatus Mycobacterium wuenschmannii]
MSEPNTFDLLELATPYALHAISDGEREAIDRQLAAAPTPVANAFGDEVRSVQEAMALVASATAAEPPEQLRDAVLAAVAHETSRRSRWRTAILAAAAAIVVALAAFGASIALRPTHTPTMTEQIMSASDVRTVTGDVAGGRATVSISKHMNAAVLVMNNVPPPLQGTVYQMWLVGDKGPVSAGTMNAAAITPTMTHTFTDIRNSSVLAFTVEPGEGSPQPTGTIFAKFPLT